MSANLQQNGQIPQTEDAQNAETVQQIQQQESLNKQQLLMILNPLIQQDGQRNPDQNEQITQEQINEILQEQFKKLNLELYQEKPSLSQRICFFFLYLVLNMSASVVFGVLMWVFYDQGDKNDYCEHDELKKWAQTTAIMLFILSGVQAIKTIDDIFLKSQFETNGKLFCITRPLESLLGIGLFVTTIGLTITNSSDCGQFYKLVLAFCIVYYISLGFGVIILIIFLCKFLQNS